MPPPSIFRSSAASAAVVVLLACAAAPAAAEKADRDKPLHIEADRMVVDDKKKESLFEGKVVITQGTMRIEGSRVIVRQDAEGFQYGIAYGKPATFRQKREGVDEYVDGYAERLEFDGKKDLLQMFTNARLTKGADEVRGDYISYNAQTEFFQVTGGGKAASTPTNPEGRVRAVIQPKPKQAPAENDVGPEGGTALKPARELQGGSKR